MTNTRRWFIYLVLLIVLLAVSNATAELLRFLFNLQREYYASRQLATSIATILVGLPVYIFLWLWVKRKSGEVEEKHSLARTLYLYFIIAISTDFLIHNSFSFVRSLLHVILNIYPQSYRYYLSPQQYLLYYAIPILIFAGILFYHWKINHRENEEITGNPYHSIFRQIYQYLSAGTGMVMLSLALISILRWILEKLIYPNINLIPTNLGISSEIARLIVGTAIWIIFWNSAQKIYLSLGKEERESTIRKIYLYLILFGSIVLVVASAALLLQGVFKDFLGLPPSEDPTAKLLPISILVCLGLVWFYHNSVLKQDATLEVELEQKANIQRIFHYLMAGVGFAALLIGLGGVISVLIRYLFRGSLLQDLREQLSWFSALLIVGIPLWFIYWRNVQKSLEHPKGLGYEERRSFVRTYYLYFFVFLASVTTIGALIFIVSQLVEIILRMRSFEGLMTDIGQSLSYTLISLGVILYHRAILKTDSNQIGVFETGKGKFLKLILFDFADGVIGKKLMDKLSGIDGLSIMPIALSKSVAQSMGIDFDRKTYRDEIVNANGILGIISPINPETIDNERGRNILKSISLSKASKLFIPGKGEGYEWLGIDQPDERKILSETKNFIRQIKTGGEIKTSRKFTPIAILLMIAVTLCFLVSLVAPLMYILDIF